MKDNCFTELCWFLLCTMQTRHKYICVVLLATQSCPTLCVSRDYSLPGSFVHGITQARILEWVAVSSSRGSFPLRGQARQVDCLPMSCQESPSVYIYPLPFEPPPWVGVIHTLSSADWQGFPYESSGSDLRWPRPETAFPAVA